MTNSFCIKISESSQRFVKGINKDQYEFVLDLAANMLIDLADAKEVHDIVSYDKYDHTPTVIESSCDAINGRLGSNFDNELIIETLRRVNIDIDSNDGNHFLATIPNYRIDIKLDADLSEEVIRLLGFDKVESTLPKQKTTVGGLKPRQLRKRQIRDLLTNNGYNVWIAPNSIPKGIDYIDEIYSAIDNSKIIVFILCEESLDSKWCQNELIYAIKQNKKVLPIQIADVIHPYDKMGKILTITKKSNFKSIP